MARSSVAYTVFAKMPDGSSKAVKLVSTTPPENVTPEELAAWCKREALKNQIVFKGVDPDNMTIKFLPEAEAAEGQRIIASLVAAGSVPVKSSIEPAKPSKPVADVK